jgi:hypothetical protein
MSTKLTLIFSILIGGSIFSTNLLAQDSTKHKPKNANHGQFFIDEDGDGYNDNAPDHDGDGIPNGLDPDWHKMKKEMAHKKKKRFIDLDGDGVNDIMETDDPKGMKMEKHYNKKGGSMEGKEKNHQGHGKKKHGKK